MFPSLLKCSQLKKLHINPGCIRFQDDQIVYHIKILPSSTQYCSAFISAPLYCTEMFLYSRQSYRSCLSNKICMFVAGEIKLVRGALKKTQKWKKSKRGGSGELRRSISPQFKMLITFSFFSNCKCTL